MPAKPTVSVRWIAGRDRIGHAHRRGQREYLCGQRTIDERFAWPKESRCGDCEAASLAEVAMAN